MARTHWTRPFAFDLCAVDSAQQMPGILFRVTQATTLQHFLGLARCVHQRGAGSHSVIGWLLVGPIESNAAVLAHIQGHDQLTASHRAPSTCAGPNDLAVYRSISRGSVPSRASTITPEAIVGGCTPLCMARRSLDTAPHQMAPCVPLVPSKYPGTVDTRVLCWGVLASRALGHHRIWGCPVCRSQSTHRDEGKTCRKLFSWR